jgi:hypothetical protein
MLATLPSLHSDKYTAAPAEPEKGHLWTRYHTPDMSDVYCVMPLYICAARCYLHSLPGRLQQAVGSAAAFRLRHALLDAVCAALLNVQLHIGCTAAPTVRYIAYGTQCAGYVRAAK